jgi:hypothetical protein
MTNYKVYIRSWLLWAVAFVAYSFIGLVIAVLTGEAIGDWFIFFLWLALMVVAHVAAQVTASMRMQATIEDDKLVLMTTRGNIFLPDKELLIPLSNLKEVSLKEYYVGGVYLHLVTKDGHIRSLMRKEHLFSKNETFLELCVALKNAMAQHERSDTNNAG